MLTSPCNTRPQLLSVYSARHSTFLVNGAYRVCVWSPAFSCDYLRNLKKRFKYDNKCHEVCINFMHDIINKGHAELQDKKKSQQGKGCYISHHAVFHSSKPAKIRVLFYCSAEWHSISVNKSLISGLDLTNQIIWVLVKFREEPVMVHQVFVAGKHRSPMRFLWWVNENCDTSPQSFHMNVHVFDGALSPSSSN